MGDLTSKTDIFKTRQKVIDWKKRETQDCRYKHKVGKLKPDNIDFANFLKYLRSTQTVAETPGSNEGKVTVLS